MTSVPTPFAGWSFDVDDRRLAAVVHSFLEGLDAPPQLLALGEPTHGEPAFPQLRNRIFEVLVDHGFQSIAIESDRVAALDVEAFVRGEGGTLNVALDRASPTDSGSGTPTVSWWPGCGRTTIRDRRPSAWRSMASTRRWR